ncbi:hypothetical protein IKF43_02735 [Candidatus Saccharibacteria bacterium]|nr:hypothetical protein [Candidatus Saccharibacteria bacterium]
MQLIIILLTTVSILTFLSGAITFFGSSKGDRARSAWYFAAAIFATAWMSSIAFFLVAKPDSTGTIGWHVNWTFISAIFLDAAFLGYGSWAKKYGKIATLIFWIFGLVVSGWILFNPSALYLDVVLSSSGNSVVLNTGPLYFAYITFFATIVPIIVAVFFHQFLKSRSRRKKGGDIITMVSFGASSTVVLIVNLILPLFGNWSLIWLGPLALAVTILGVYYTILRYRMLNLSSIWLRIFSYIVVISSIAIVYMVIFSVIFAALFRGSTPSTEVIILNFIMILIFIALMPAMNGLMTFIRSLMVGQTSDDKKGQK